MANDDSNDHDAGSPPRRAQRILVGGLAGGLVLALGLAGGLWLWARHRLDEQERGCSGRLGQVLGGASAWAGAVATGEAEAVLRAYQAGVRPAILAGKNEWLEVSIEEMVRLPGVVFVHVLSPDGGVVASSNRKFTVTGQASERAAWALAAKDLVVRQGELAGTTELAVAIQEAAGVRAVLWMAYNTQTIVERRRPSTLSH